MRLCLALFSFFCMAVPAATQNGSIQHQPTALGESVGKYTASDRVRMGRNLANGLEDLQKFGSDYAFQDRFDSEMKKHYATLDTRHAENGDNFLVLKIAFHTPTRTFVVDEVGASSPSRETALRLTVGEPEKTVLTKAGTVYGYATIERGKGGEKTWTAGVVTGEYRSRAQQDHQMLHNLNEMQRNTVRNPPKPPPEEFALDPGKGPPPGPPPAPTMLDLSYQNPPPFTYSPVLFPPPPTVTTPSPRQPPPVVEPPPPTPTTPPPLLPQAPIEGPARM